MSFAALPTDRIVHAAEAYDILAPKSRPVKIQGLRMSTTVTSAQIFSMHPWFCCWQRQFFLGVDQPFTPFAKLGLPSAAARCPCRPRHRSFTPSAAAECPCLPRRSKLCWPRHRIFTPFRCGRMYLLAASPEASTSLICCRKSLFVPTFEAYISRSCCRMLC